MPPSIFDFFRGKKRSSSRRFVERDEPAAAAALSSETAPRSKRLAPKDGSQMMDVTQSGAAPAPPAPRQRKDAKKRREENRFNRPIVQTADDVRTKQLVELHVEELRWHSGGVFSNVYRGRMTAPEKMEVAIKKTWPKDTTRSDEMIILAAMRRASPRNVIKLLYIFRNRAADGTDCEAFVFAYMPETLDKVIRDGLNSIDLKMYAWQLFNGLDFLAANRICHRDIKPINILVNRDTGELQIGDFGSAKVISSRDKPSSPYQVTRYYRPPEMLLGSTHYSHLVDVWSCGCVLGEMIKGRVLFRGSDSENQLHLIQSALGTPTDEQLRQLRAPKTAKISRITKQGLLVSLRLQSSGSSEPPRLPASTAQAVALLRRILVYNPDARLCGKELLEDAFFHEVLSPTCVRANGRRPDLARQSEETMGHPMTFERYKKSLRETASRLAQVSNALAAEAPDEPSSQQQAPPEKSPAPPPDADGNDSKPDSPIVPPV